MSGRDEVAVEIVVRQRSARDEKVNPPLDALRDHRILRRWVVRAAWHMHDCRVTEV